MSLGVIQLPEFLSPVNNPVPIVFSSSFSSEDGFRYKVVLFDSNGDTSEMWIYPDTDNNNYCIYDFSMLLSDIVGSNKNWDVTGQTQSFESRIGFWFSVTEYIGSTSGDTYPYNDMYSVFRGVKQYGDFWDTTDYTMTGSTSKFLSNKISRKYKLDEYATINSLKGTFDTDNSNWDQVVIDLYNGDFLKRYTFTEFPSTYPLPNILTIPIGPENLNQMSNGGLITNSGTTLPVVGDLLDDTSVWYEIHLQSKGDIVSETIRIYLDHKCYRHDGVQFLYLGDLSTYETISARMADSKSFKTKRSETKTSYYGMNSSSYDYSIGDRGRNVVNVRNQEERVALTDWIKDDEATDLMELFRSPDVYIIQDDEIYPIVITTSSYDKKIIRNDRLFNYTIKFDLAYEKLSNI